jgi:hypothetical protein
MTSAFSTITNNVNLLLVDTSVITTNNPYVAYVSSVSIPGRIATIRDSIGYLSSANQKIIISSMKDVLFNLSTSSISITQPFGFVSLISRDKNTWNVINNYAFPGPTVAYVSSVYITDTAYAGSYFASQYVSTPYVNTSNISSYDIVASNSISTNTLFTNTISTNSLQATNFLVPTGAITNLSTSSAYISFLSSANILVNSISSLSLQTNSISTNSITTNSISTPNILTNSISTINLTASIISTNILFAPIISTINLQASNILTNNITTSGISTINITTNSISTTNLQATSISTNLLFTNSITANSISTTNLQANTISTNLLLAPSISTLNLRATTISTQNLLATTIQGTTIQTSNISSFFYGGIEKYNYVSSISLQSTTRGLGNIYVSSLSNWAQFPATANLNMNNNSITNVNNLTTSGTNTFGFEAYFNDSVTITSNNLYLDSIRAYTNPLITFANGIDMNNNNIDNIDNLGVGLINGFSISEYYNANWAQFSATENVNMNNKTINNLIQTTVVNDAATNDITAQYLINDIGTTSFSGTIQIQPTPPIRSGIFRNRGGFTNFKVTFTLVGEGVVSPIELYFKLFNDTSSDAVSGTIVNSFFPYQEEEHTINNRNHSITYTDIYDLSPWNNGDTYYPLLYIASSGATVNFNSGTILVVLEPTS